MRVIICSAEDISGKLPEGVFNGDEGQMRQSGQDERIRQLESEIAALPKGSISRKRINGKVQPYLQWTENGKRRSRYLKAGEREEVMDAVARRRRLEEELRSLRREYTGSAAGAEPSLSRPTAEQRYAVYSARQPAYAADMEPLYGDAASFETQVITGEALSRMCARVSAFRRRPCIRTLQQFLTSGQFGRVCLIYGLRRTGKSTMVLQAISDLPAAECAYIRVMTSDRMASLCRDLNRLAASGVQYVFIDEVTLLRDFIDSASMFSDIFGMQGMKIVLSGTDSLGFLLSAEDELYDRAVMIHTTFISFREYASILNIHDVDEYIRYGGTFRVGETGYGDPERDREGIPFLDEDSTRRYIDTSVARNIQHSLAWYQDGGHFRHLLDLYEADELTSAVNRVIEDMNHRFLLSVLTKDFVSHDLGMAVRNLRKETRPAYRSDALELIDAEQVTEDLRRILEIRNGGERRVALTQDHVREIREYLQLLDLIVDCPIETIGGSRPVEHILFAQPGMRYAQAQALVQALVRDLSFSALSAAERRMVTQRILDEVKGRMLEEIILLETLKAAPRTQHVCKLQFAVGEFDMVIADTQKDTCRIYEIKHSTEKDPAQYRHLLDREKCEKTQFRYGSITERCVIYRGPDGEQGGIRYRNAERYLEELVPG